MRALTPEQMEVVGVEQLEAEEGENDLKRERATIHKVTIEELKSVVKHDDAQVLDSGLLAAVGLDTKRYKRGGLH